MTAGIYKYDYLFRLVSRELLSVPVTLHLVHDLDGNVIAEYDATGTLLTEYIWLEDRPVGMVADAGTLSPKVYWVHTDHLERPVMMTDATADVVWQASYLPFGEVASITGSATLDYRFPGQWFQLESGLAYNWHRHYDATTGRYVQPDPLGMPDGPARWAYATNSPLTKIDKDGLQAGSQMSVIPRPQRPSLPICEVGTVTQICRRIGISTGLSSDLCVYRCPDQSIKGIGVSTFGAANDNCPAIWAFPG